MKVLVTGGAGFVGSHVAEYYAKKCDEVAIFDNLSRATLLGYGASNAVYNWNYLKSYANIDRIKGDIRDIGAIEAASKDADVIIHTAAQTAVTTSVKDPRTDFEINALGTFNVLEAARKSNASVIFCSTNKVYGDNVNKIPVKEQEKRYVFNDSKYKNGIKEIFLTDLCEHTPYGASKFSGDTYVQDYAHVYGLKTAVFRMSCIYGTRQFGVEDQGWVAWFIIATLTNKPITIYGDGKQVRDVLYVDDLVKAYDLFIESNLKQEVFNIGGGSENTLSLLELLDLLKDSTDMRAKISYDDWRPSDQKIYISDIGKIREKLKWKPKVNPREGVNKLVDWVKENSSLFSMGR
ncbi:MAG: GDP-mannose 4,6-dehydratase [Methanocellales archaeon]|nr:GDP-mannose 4,6-dehydratase [Methanocellales archaeon]